MNTEPNCEYTERIELRVKLIRALLKNAEAKAAHNGLDMEITQIIDELDKMGADLMEAAEKADLYEYIMDGNNS